jgi:hypothetical protein
MGYVREQMTMDDLKKIFEDIRSSKEEKEVLRKFEYVFAAPEADRAARLRHYCWAIDREKHHYILCTEDGPDGPSYIFYFCNSVYTVLVERGSLKYNGWTRSHPEPPNNLKNEFQREFIEGCRVYCTGTMRGAHPVWFKNDLTEN